ncbi:MAG: hypothetical protein AABY10_01140 [Nanoarchaeota archaeon]
MINAFPLVDEWMRFVVLRHSGVSSKPDHYDILLEITVGDDDEDIALDKLESKVDDLTSMRVDVDPQDMIRRRYLNYEGPMRDNRGFVIRVDEGRYKIREDGCLEFEGSLLKGFYHFEGEEDLVMVR